MAQLSNCKQCGKVFVESLRNICQDCYREEENKFKKVYRFVRQRKNREATIDEIVEETEVEEELIIKFIKEKRLQVAKFPNLEYPCEKCGIGIVRGKICGGCATSIRKEAMFHEEQEKRMAKRKELEEQGSVYFTMNKDKR